jgi:hypothetical protein
VYFCVTIRADKLKIVRIVTATITSSNNMMHNKNIYVAIATTLAPGASLLNQTFL